METKPARTYQKPVIERIRLVGEESAGVPNCKRTINGGGKNIIANPCDIISVAKCRDDRGS